MKRLILLIIPFLALPNFAQVLSQEGRIYTEADTLRGSLRAERAYDVLKYHLKVRVEPEERYISGSNTITFEAGKQLPVMQIDLFENMKIDSIIHRNEKLDYNRKFNAVFVDLKQPVQKGERDSILVFYSGNPLVAKNAPWDGGFVFEKDNNGDHWIAVAVQGTGASLWYPNKDHQSDEPQEVLTEVEVPTGLMNVSNGRLVSQKELEDGYTRWSWKVINPINNYNIVLNIGNYVHFSDTLKKDNYRNLDLDYYVLPYNLEKAKKQFEEVKPMMDCFYEKFGEYPFVEDGFTLVETPYLGMEHQSAVAYGNHYMKGYLGRDLSGTGIGLKWDFIIIHETGHEWFGNSITARDIADMWIHEGFTSYSEAVYIECRWGKEEALEYIKGIRSVIANDKPIIGEYGVNSEGSGDMYFKGSNLLNTIRSIYNDDQLWWKTLRDYTTTYRHQIITTEITEEFFNKAITVDLKPVFDQYLRHAAVPLLQFRIVEDRVSYRWQADVKNFEMPVDIFVKNKELRITPTSSWQQLPAGVKPNDIRINDRKYYINSNLSSL
ncbi:M1 family metallopeptidase [Antarcticibacterium flavum]|uniref:M1 family metallopeptidase n=1 Tax=Antarcticibacterium flavum TaxID=2058175 RepID=A0A5B7X6S4_9FLAO|nr:MULTISPECIES: M1 family metallopeptidase [Antarcticibacterium]MCM4159602.1 peptidase M1 [Antarcticibacterium sp. W02-3]QCY70850.1 M1 family metallopeptidase [Antarcticibacterium flavum]